MPRDFIDVTDTPVPVKAKKTVTKKTVSKKTPTKKVTTKTPAKTVVKKTVSASVKTNKKPLSVDQLYGFLEAIAEGEEFSVEQRMKATLTLLNKKGEHMSDQTPDTSPKRMKRFPLAKSSLKSLEPRLCKKLLSSEMAEYKRKSLLSSLTPTELLVLAHDWQFWARDEQLPPQSDWRIWLILAGRGWGKTRTGAEWVIASAIKNPSARIALVGETLADARSVMVEGESGILAVAPLWMRPKFEPSKRLLTFPNGAMATLYSADEPEQLRGPQFSHAWGDELGKWNYDASFENLQLALRLGEHPQLLLTTTPRPTPLLKKLLAQKGVAITRGTTFDNQANLPKVFLKEIIAAFDGTRLGRQELYAEMLEEVTGALWTRQMIEHARVQKMPVMQRIVVGVDPAVSYSAISAETGIVVAGLGQDGAYYVLADASGKMSVDTWAKRVIATYHQWQASRVVAEVNNGGALVEQMLRGHAADLSYKAVRASYGKLARAEPIAALYEQGKVHHVGMFPLLEDQLCQFDGTGTVSPDRLDALVWALTELMQVPKGRGEFRIRIL